MNLDMNDQVEQIFERLHGTADFADADFSDVNATSTDMTMHSITL